MFGSFWRLIGWLVLPAALVLALIVFSPFAAVFATWALLHPDLFGTLLFIVLAVYFVRKGARAAATLYELATRKRHNRKAVDDLALAAVQRAVLR